MMPPLTVLGFGYVAPYARDVDARSALESELPKLDLALLERTLRRGLSEVTRLFMHAAKLALADAQTSPDQVQVIFGSAFGEIATAEALLAEAYDANGSSPARFSKSVHNTATGLFSISTKNHLPCTAVAAGWETVAMGLFEAAAQLEALHDGVERVLLVFAEERVPLALSAEHSHGPLGAAFVLARGQAQSGRARATLSLPQRGVRSELDVSPRELENHPLAPVLALAQMLEQQRSGRLIVSDGELPWCIDVAACQSARPEEST
ncbi:MAG: hypothetical protein JWN48_3240 [Myxococcaceae bacterium]|nr:hypothetical protein [Myxococcaceae bacterium]